MSTATSTTAGLQNLLQTNRSSETALVESFRAGDPAAFEKLVAVYGKKFQRAALRVTGNFHDAEDAIQHAMLKAFEHRHSFRGASKLGTWLMRIALNEAAMVMRKKRRSLQVLPLERKSPSGTITALDILDDRETVLEAAERRERENSRKEALREAIQKLPPTLQRAVACRDVQGLTIKETAAYLNLPEGTVKAQTTRGRARIREAFLKALKERTH